MSTYLLKTNQPHRLYVNVIAYFISECLQAESKKVNIGDASVIFPERSEGGEVCFLFERKMYTQGELLEPGCAHVINKDLIP